MEFITTTELRTKSPKLIDTLRLGGYIRLVHRSQIIGTIIPSGNRPKIFNSKQFFEAIKNLSSTKTTPKQREAIYRKRLEKKYGQYLS